MDFVIDELAEFYDVIPTGTLPSASWNIAPTQRIVTILDGTDGIRHMAPSHWSLIPPWSPTMTLSYPSFNARIETALEKRTYAHAAQTQRCIIPACGYYEWRNHKDPFFFSLPQGEALSIAGLYSWWRASSHNAWILTSTILTRDATENVQSIHDRMPVFITSAMRDSWLDPSVSGHEILPAARNRSAQLAHRLQFWQVGPLQGDNPSLTNKLIV